MSVTKLAQLEPGNKLTNGDTEVVYTLVKLIGKGASGAVWTATTNDPDYPKVILKMFDRDTYYSRADWLYDINRELAFADWSTAAAMKNGKLEPCEGGLDCPFASFFASGRGLEVGGLVLRDRGAVDLNAYYRQVLHPALQREDPARRRFVHRQGIKIAKLLCSRLAVMHALGAVHADIKTGNVIVSLSGDREVLDLWLIDFGLSCTARFNQLLVLQGLRADTLDCWRSDDGKGFVYITTPEFADPRSRIDDDVNRPPRVFADTEYLEAFQKFDLYSAALTAWYAWAPDAYERMRKNRYPGDPTTRTAYTPRFVGYVPPPMIGGVDMHEQSVLDENGALCFLFTKMAGKMTRRLSAGQMNTLFLDLMNYKAE